MKHLKIISVSILMGACATAVASSNVEERIERLESAIEVLINDVIRIGLATGVTVESTPFGSDSTAPSDATDVTNVPSSGRVAVYDVNGIKKFVGTGYAGHAVVEHDGVRYRFDETTYVPADGKNYAAFGDTNDPYFTVITNIYYTTSDCTGVEYLSNWLPLKTFVYDFFKIPDVNQFASHGFYATKENYRSGSITFLSSKSLSGCETFGEAYESTMSMELPLHAIDATDLLIEGPIEIIPE